MSTPTYAQHEGLSALPYEIAQEIETYLKEMADVEVESITARRKQLDREAATAKERLASPYEDKLSGELSVEPTGGSGRDTRQSLARRRLRFGIWCQRTRWQAPDSAEI